MSDLNSYKTQVYTCRKCKWSGVGEQTKNQEYFGEVFEIGCPQCNEYLGTVSYYPVDVQVKSNKEIKKQQTPKLKSIDQLPEIDSDEIVITIREDGHTEFVLYHGDTEIWREDIVYEYYRKYLAIGEILIEKYGDRLADFDDSKAGESYLGYFTGVSAVDSIQKLRKKIQQNSRAQKNKQ